MKYRKKPIVIEAFQMTPEAMASNVDWPNWAHEAWNKDPQEGGLWCDEYGGAGQKYWCGTLEGVHIVSPNDYLIKGIKGEIYPCKPDIFEATYEKAEE